MVKVLLVDDHELVRTGIGQLLANHESIQVVGVAGSGEEAVVLADTLLPDIVLMDINMPGIGGMEASRKIHLRHPDIRIIILTVISDTLLPQQLLSAGMIQGYLTKHCTVDDLLTAIMTVYQGERYICFRLAKKLALSNLNGSRESNPFGQLSNRELQVVLLTLEGRDVNETAAALNISPKTVSTYRHRVYDKLGVRNDVELLRLALKHKLLDSL